MHPALLSTLRPLRRKARLTLCIITQLTVFSAASFNVELSSLKVVLPPGSKQSMSLAMADFGQPKYGGTLRGQLAYPGPEYTCSPEKCCYGCSPFNESDPPYQLVKGKGQVSIMLLDRGSEKSSVCYFLHKVYNAQMAGADAVVIVNNVNGSNLSTAVPPEEEMILRLLPLIKISAALISLEDGMALKHMLSANGAVTIQLSWQDILPKREIVTWEFWTNSNDQCATSCDQQRAFVKAMQPYAKKMEQAGMTTFTPHYMMWSCPKAYIDTPGCLSQCIANGSYCVPDPDGALHEGYSGVDVLKVNLAQLCFYQVAKAARQPWLWWSYADRFGDTCRMADKAYGRECGEQVASSVLATTSSDTVSSLQDWNNCIDSNLGLPLTGGAGSGRTWGGVGALFDSELLAQYGEAGEEAVSILPTVRINGRQFRGTLEVGTVTRALCAGFKSGEEPLLCNEGWVSENECLPGNEGYVACANKVGEGRTQCINTFAGWDCACGDGWLRITDPVTGQDSCADINECAVPEIMAAMPDCACDRCACINRQGSFTCTGELPNLCNEEYQYGGCWAAKLDGERFSACFDLINRYKSQAAGGNMPLNATYTGCRCPPCFAPAPDNTNTCNVACDLRTCDRRRGCTVSAGTTGGHGGPGFATMFFSVAAAIAASCVVVAGGYSLYLRRTMHQEVREIMSTYMPLEDMEQAHARSAFGFAASLPLPGPGPFGGNTDKGVPTRSGAGGSMNFETARPPPPGLSSRAVEL